MPPIPERQREIDALVRKHLSDLPSKANGHKLANPSGDLTDDQILELCRRAKNAAKFRSLYDAGDTVPYDGDDSSADLALISILAFYTRDHDQLDRLFSGSALYREEKWGKRADYRRRTIEKALSDRAETYTPGDGATLVAGAPSEEHDQAGHTAEEFLEVASSEPEKPRERFPRVDLAAAIEKPLERLAMLVENILYAARVHGLYSAGGMGKSWLALWLIARVIDQGQDVFLLDLENGMRIVSDRLRDMGVDPAMVRRHLHYVPFPSMPQSADAIAEFVALLEEVEPALVVIDSWINCLAAAGLDENSAVDIALWAEAYPQQARKRGIAVLILDHVPKEGGSARGSGRKLDYVDVMWELRNPCKFDRETIGRIDLHLRKDREGWMPSALAFRIGGGLNGFVFEPFRDIFQSADEATGLLGSDRTTLDALRSFGERGATDKEWREETERRGPARSTYYLSKKNLIGLAHVDVVAGRFVCKTPANDEFNEVQLESNETE